MNMFSLEEMKVDIARVSKALGVFEKDECMYRLCDILHKHLEKVDTRRLPWKSILALLKAEFFAQHWDFDNNTIQVPDEGSFHLIQGDPKSIFDRIIEIFNQWIAPEGSGSYMNRDNFIDVVDTDIMSSYPSFTYSYPKHPIINEIAPELPRRTYVEKTPKVQRHWGQRKLLLVEIEFLSQFITERSTVVYAGAAPGVHIGILSSLFPNVQLVLVDPAPFDIELDVNGRILHQMFDDELAAEFSALEDVLFISDIRRNNISEKMIIKDMQLQERWHEIMQPKASLLKFRLPWRKGKTKYLKGRMMFQPYTQPHSTETRLLVQGQVKAEYDHTEYEEKCFFFNTIVRNLPHPHGVPESGLPDSYDSAREIEILRAYLMSQGKSAFPADIAKVSISISEALPYQKNQNFKRFMP